MHHSGVGQPGVPAETRKNGCGRLIRSTLRDPEVGSSNLPPATFFSLDIFERK